MLTIGDIAFYHDMNGLLAAKLHGLNATIVLINNDGGGIFSFLPQAAHPEHFEALFGTPHGLDFRPAAELYGASYHLVDGWDDFRAIGLHVLECAGTQDRRGAHQSGAKRGVAPRGVAGGFERASRARRSMPKLDVNGVTFNVERAGSGPALLLLHGFTGSAETWTDHARIFGDAFTTYTIDLIGHGRTDSPADLQHYRMEQCVADVIAILDRLDLERTALLGYSMGGRVALHLALTAPERIRALVLESASPGIDDPTERAARVRADEALADSIERDGLEAFVDRWENVPIFASQRQLPSEVWQRQREQRLQNSSVGLANSLRGMGAGAMEPVWARLGDLAMPVFLMVGELDEKYLALGKKMEIALPNARLLIAEDAGHAVHLEAPHLFDRAVSSWLRNVGAAT